MEKQINVAKLSKHFKSWQNCRETNNSFWETKWKASIMEQLEHLPSGSGLDVGIKFDWNNSTPECLRFKFPYHHMDENGNYIGWTHHELLIQPSLSLGFNLEITGEDKDGILDYLYQLFHSIFCHEPNYNQEKGSFKQQLLAQYQHLKTLLTPKTSPKKINPLHP